MFSNSILSKYLLKFAVYCQVTEVIKFPLKSIPGSNSRLVLVLLFLSHSFEERLSDL